LDALPHKGRVPIYAALPAHNPRFFYNAIYATNALIEKPTNYSRTELVMLDLSGYLLDNPEAAIIKKFKSELARI
jgi:hypothetical protein